MITVHTMECPNPNCIHCLDLCVSYEGTPSIDQVCKCKLEITCDDGKYDVRHLGDRGRYIIAVYEEDRAYGGPEEGGWWYDCGQLVRLVKIVRGEDNTYTVANRINSLLAYRRKLYRTGNISSINYDGGYLAAHVYEDVAPSHFPAHRPHYE